MGDVTAKDPWFCAQPGCHTPALDGSRYCSRHDNGQVRMLLGRVHRALRRGDE